MPSPSVEKFNRSSCKPVADAGLSIQDPYARQGDRRTPSTRWIEPITFITFAFMSGEEMEYSDSLSSAQTSLS